MNTDRTNIPDFVYNVTGSCSIIAFICLNNSYNVPWTLQARRQRSLELAAESKQMPSTGPYNEVIDRADLETAGHPFHISFMAALIRAWRTVSNASQHSRERAWKEEGKKKETEPDRASSSTTSRFVERKRRWCERLRARFHRVYGGQHGRPRWSCETEIPWQISKKDRGRVDRWALRGRIALIG